jgi:hypothetical protein
MDDLKWPAPLASEGRTGAGGDQKRSCGNRRAGAKNWFGAGRKVDWDRNP